MLSSMLNPQNTLLAARKGPCIFHINIKGLKGGLLTSVEGVIRDIFKAAGQDVRFNEEQGANANTGAYNLEVRGNFSKEVMSRLSQIEKQFAVGYSPYDPSTLRFLGWGEIATKNLASCWVRSQSIFSLWSGWRP